MSNMLDLDALKEEQQELVREGRQAAAILDNPLVKKFFDQERQLTLANIEALEFPGAQVQYMALHAYLNVLSALKDFIFQKAVLAEKAMFDESRRERPRHGDTIRPGAGSEPKKTIRGV